MNNSIFRKLNFLLHKKPNTTHLFWKWKFSHMFGEDDFCDRYLNTLGWKMSASYTSNFLLHCCCAIFDLVYCFQVSFTNFYAPCFVSKFPSKEFIDIFAQMFEATSLLKLSRIMKFDNSTISMIKSWKFNVFLINHVFCLVCVNFCVLVMHLGGLGS